MSYQPEITHAGVTPIHTVTATDEKGQTRSVTVVGENPLTLLINNHPLVTLMTLGRYPEALAIGYLRNQHIIEDLQAIKTVHVDWASETVQIKTYHELHSLSCPTTNCGQGTTMNKKNLTPVKAETIRYPAVLSRSGFQ